MIWIIQFFDSSVFFSFFQFLSFYFILLHNIYSAFIFPVLILWLTLFLHCCHQLKREYNIFEDFSELHYFVKISRYFNNGRISQSVFYFELTIIGKNFRTLVCIYKISPTEIVEYSLPICPLKWNVSPWTAYPLFRHSWTCISTSEKLMHVFFLFPLGLKHCPRLEWPFFLSEAIYFIGKAWARKIVCGYEGLIYTQLLIVTLFFWGTCWNSPSFWAQYRVWKVFSWS